MRDIKRRYHVLILLLQTPGDHIRSFHTRGIIAEKDYLIHISKAIITLFSLSYEELDWCHIKAKALCNLFPLGPKSKESLYHQSQRKWLGQIPPVFLQAESGRILQRLCYLRKGKARNLLTRKIISLNRDNPKGTP